MTNSVPSFGALVHEIERLFKKRFDRFAETTGMSRPQWHVLAHIAKREGINQASLADTVGVEPISVCRMVDRLETLGLVERRADPNDRRARLLYTTEAARPGVERMRAAARELFAEGLTGLTPQEVETLNTLLRRVHENLLVGSGEDSPFADPKLTRLERVLEDDSHG